VFTSVRSVYSALGVMLFLIALYLLLRNAAGATDIIRAGGATTNSIFRTLQGR
jgi:hypothetical protein